MKLLGFCYSLAVLSTFVSHTIAVPYFEKRQATSPGVTPDQIDLTLFANLEPNKDLKWVTCYQAYCCARLEVPLNYDEPHGKKIQLALVKLPAKPEARYKGALYLQIGLGVPATNLVLEFGPSFQIPTLEGYDIIGWDVRGAGQSTPLLTCFPDQSARLAYLGAAPKILGDPSYRTLEEGIRANLEYAKTFGEACRERSGEFLPYYDTPNSARDLHTIMKATGAKTITAFWGYQYATLLGETFATLFPHAFDHLILDGVVDGELQYGFGDVLPSSIQDTEKAFRVFFDSCFKAGPGPTGCAFYADSLEKIRERYKKVENKLIDSPILVPGLGTFDYSAQHRLISGAVTDPNNLFPFLAAVLAEAESGMAGDAIKGILSFPLPPLPTTGIDGPFEYSSAVQCLDSDPYQLKETKDFKKYLKSMLETSPCCGSTVAQLKLVCAGSLPFTEITLLMC